MAEFTCRVGTVTGEVFEKNYTAQDEAALRRELEAQDLMILSVRQRNPVLQQLARLLRLHRGVPSNDFLFFNQEFRALLNAGLPVVPSLEILLERRKHKLFKRVLLDVRDRVRGGEALSDAFAAQGDLFPPLYSASLASGERSGELVSVIDRFVIYLKKVLGIRRKVTSALIYPAVLLVLMFCVIGVMVFFVVPRFNAFLKDFGTDLPLVTKIVVNSSLFAVHYWYLLLGGALGGFIGLSWWSKTDTGRVALDRFVLRVPLVGRVVHDYAQNRFTRTLATLVAGGIPLVTALDLAARAVGNAVFEQALLRVAAEVREGQSLHASLDRTGLMSDMAIQMVKVGESTGALDAMLDNASEFTDEEIDARLDRVVSLIEPLMLVVMAIIVGLLLFSIYYPMVRAYGEAQA